MRRVLSIQMQSVGHKTYAGILRECSAERDDIRMDSFWAHDERSLWTRMVRRVAQTKLPGLSRRNLDLRRARAEWSTGHMSRKLATKKLHLCPYDLLHFHTQTAAYGSVHLMRKVPTVVTIDMTGFQLAREFNAGPAWTYYPNLVMERNVFGAAAHIVAFSDWARQSVISECGIAPDRVSVITPGVLVEKFPEPVYETRGKPKILFVGNEFVRKGGDDLLAVFLQHLAGKAELHLVTNDPVEISHPAVFVHSGVVAYSEEWHRFYRESDIFAMISRAEALGMVFQEAAATGLALIGTTVGGIPEMITHGSNGFLISPGDRHALTTHLGNLIDDSTLRQRMRKASREKALREFDARKNTSRLLDLLNTVSHREAPRNELEAVVGG